MGRQRTRLHLKSRQRDSARAAVSDHRTDSSVHRGSVQHVTNRQDLPPLTECVPSGVHVHTAGAEAGAQVPSGSVRCSLQGARNPQGPTRDCQDTINVHGDDRSSSSSASSANKPRKKRARKTLAAQHDTEGRVDAADSLQEQNTLRGDRRGTRARAAEHGGPTYRGGFGTDITNRGAVGRVQSSGGSFPDGEESKGLEGKMGPRESTPTLTASRKVRAKRFCGRDVWGSTFGAASVRKTIRPPVGTKGIALVIGGQKRMCRWTHTRYCQPRRLKATSPLVPPVPSHSTVFMQATRVKMVAVVTVMARQRKTMPATAGMSCKALVIGAQMLTPRGTWR